MPDSAGADDDGVEIEAEIGLGGEADTLAPEIL